ncbi:hypothetical protein BGX21_008075 [Mortierella sp. AD011]|nr:hypothetical protein BGX20_008180 [Mortierella sp. AD010]KAF9398190.1 hypothetical protein BGX21_008075 [Mortierella sp. AD011]
MSDNQTHTKDLQFTHQQGEADNQEKIVRDLFTRIQGYPGANHFSSVDPSKYSQSGYVQFRGQYAVNHQNARMKEYNRFMDIFRNCQSTVHRDFARISKRLSKKLVQRYLTGSVDGSEVGTNNEVNTESNSNVASISILGPSSLDLMRDEFNDNYDAYKGTSWVLPSGSEFDEVVRNHVLGQTRQCSTHSFVWDSKDDLSPLFPHEEDTQALKLRIDSMKAKKQQLPQWQKDIISRYNSLQSVEDATENGIKQKVQVEGVEEQDYKKFNKMIFEFMSRIISFYGDYGHQNELKEGLSERNYLKLWSIFFRVLVKNGGIFYLDEGEVYSKASADRKNATRSLEDRQSSGHKIDGLFYCLKASKLEVAGIEGGKKNEGANGTKVLLDGLKMSKLLKDMFNYACNEACSKGTLADTARSGIEAYGFLVSALRVGFVTLKQFGGRYSSYLFLEKAESHLDDESFLIIKSLLIIFLKKRQQMEDLAKRLGKMINREYDDDDIEEYLFASTMTTPPSSLVLKKLRIYIKCKRWGARIQCRED